MNANAMQVRAPRWDAIQERWWGHAAGGARLLVALVGAMVTVVLATGTGFLVWLSGGGVQPEDVLPDRAVAFVKVDLEPSADSSSPTSWPWCGRTSDGSPRTRARRPS